jgi:hypothetical protein
VFNLFDSLKRYQCSEQSTDAEVEAIYHSAIDRQNTFEQEDAFSCNARSVVLLDEAGLPKEKEMPLKVINITMQQVLII